jgi:hypothetical protein
MSPPFSKKENVPCFAISRIGVPARVVRKMTPSRNLEAMQ